MAIEIFKGFYENENDPNLGKDFIVKNSLLDIFKREYEFITAVYTTIGTLFTSASLDIADDAMNEGIMFVQDDNNKRQIIPITDSAVAGNITADPANSFFGDASGAFTDAKEYTITVMSKQRYIGETDEKLIVPGVDYNSVYTRAAPQIKWLTYETGSDPMLNFNLSSNNLTLDIILFKLVQENVSDWHVADIDADRPSFVSVIKDIETSGKEVRRWLFPKTQFRNSNNRNTEATSSDEIKSAIVMDVLRDSILYTDKMLKSTAA